MWLFMIIANQFLVVERFSDSVDCNHSQSCYFSTVRQNILLSFLWTLLSCKFILCITATVTCFGDSYFRFPWLFPFSHSWVLDFHSSSVFDMRWPALVHFLITGYLANCRATDFFHLCQETNFSFETLTSLASWCSLEETVALQFTKWPASLTSFLNG